MSERSQSSEVVIDASALPSYGYGHRSLMWWGTAGIIAIEATVFALAVFTYFYIRTRVDVWPPSVQPPDLLWGTLNVIVMLLSLVPNQWTKKMAEAEDLPKVRLGLIACLAIALVFVIVRGFELAALNVRWDTNAYGSAVWMIMGLHTVHLLTDYFDSAVLTVLMHRGPLEGKRFVDVSENAVYWYFVVIAWVPLYAVVYWGPRLL